MHNESIKHSVDTLMTFILIHKERSKEERLQAIENFALGAGLDEDNWDLLCDLLSSKVKGDAAELGWALTGFMMGLYAAEREGEIYEASRRDAGL